MARRKAPPIRDDLLDQLLGGMDAASALNSPDWMNGLKKALAERALSAEMDYHLGAEGETENSRNGYLPIPTLEVLPTTSHLGWAATSIQRCSPSPPYAAHP